MFCEFLKRFYYCGFFMEQSKKIPTLKQRHMFGKVYTNAVFRSSGGVVVYCLKNYDRKNTLLGISVSKKRGNAVVRNRTRRINNK
jgi:ribonuclease P protein component